MGKIKVIRINTEERIRKEEKRVCEKRGE